MRRLRNGRGFRWSSHHHALGPDAARRRARTVDHGFRPRRPVGQGEGGLRGNRDLVARMMRDVPPCFRLVGTTLHRGQPRRSALERRDHLGHAQPDLVGVDELHAGGRQRRRTAQLGHQCHGAGRQHGAAHGAETICRCRTPSRSALSSDGAGRPAAGHRLGAARTCRRRSAPIPGAARTWSTRPFSPPPQTRRWRRGTQRHQLEPDVFCLSAGPTSSTRLLRWCLGPTRFGTCREGDDFTYVIQGGTR